MQIAKDPTTKNVGDLNVDNAEPVAFNHLTGHFTEALVGSAEGGSDQTASWGGTPVIRPAVHNSDNMMPLGDYMDSERCESRRRHFGRHPHMKTPITIHDGDRLLRT